ncbi:hypothetical protein QYM36_009723, partial [Artemia franciscana]
MEGVVLAIVYEISSLEVHCHFHFNPLSAAEKKKLVYSLIHDVLACAVEKKKLVHILIHDVLV